MCLCAFLCELFCDAVWIAVVVGELAVLARSLVYVWFVRGCLCDDVWSVFVECVRVNACLMCLCDLLMIPRVIVYVFCVLSVHACLCC